MCKPCFFCSASEDLAGSLSASPYPQSLDTMVLLHVGAALGVGIRFLWFADRDGKSLALWGAPIVRLGVGSRAAGSVQARSRLRLYCIKSAGRVLAWTVDVGRCSRLSATG